MVSQNVPGHCVGGIGKLCLLIKGMLVGFMGPPDLDQTPKVCHLENTNLLETLRTEDGV